MIRYSIGLVALFATPLAPQTLTVTTPLVDRDGDGKVTLTKAMPPFKKGDTIRLCADRPRYTYAIGCPSVAAANATLTADPFAIAAPLRTYAAGTKHVWHNSYPLGAITIEEYTA